MLEQIDQARHTYLKSETTRIGPYGILGSDDAMTTPSHKLNCMNFEEEYVKQLVIGDTVRDFTLARGEFSIHPYDKNRNLVPLERMPNLAKWMWPSRSELGNRATFSGRTYFREGRPWWEWHQLPKDPDAHLWSITYAFVATHNHFTLDRTGKVLAGLLP